MTAVNHREQQGVADPAVIEQLAVIGQAGKRVLAQERPMVERHPAVEHERYDEESADQDRGRSDEQGAGEPTP